MYNINESYNTNNRLIKYFKNTPSIKYVNNTPMNYNSSNSRVNNNLLYRYIGDNYEKLCKLYLQFLPKDLVEQYKGLNNTSLFDILEKVKNIKLDIDNELYALIIKNIKDVIFKLYSSIKSLFKENTLLSNLDVIFSSGFSNIIMSTIDDDIIEYDNDKHLENIILLSIDLAEGRATYLYIGVNTLNSVSYIIEQHYIKRSVNDVLHIFNITTLPSSPNIISTLKKQVEHIKIKTIKVNNLNIPILTNLYTNDISTLFSNIDKLFNTYTRKFSLDKSDVYIDKILSGSYTFYYNRLPDKIKNVLKLLNHNVKLYVIKYADNNYNKSSGKNMQHYPKYPLNSTHANFYKNSTVFMDLYKKDLYAHNINNITYVLEDFLLDMYDIGADDLYDLADENILNIPDIIKNLKAYTSDGYNFNGKIYNNMFIKAMLQLPPLLYDIAHKYASLTNEIKETFKKLLNDIFNKINKINNKIQNYKKITI